MAPFDPPSRLIPLLQTPSQNIARTGFKAAARDLEAAFLAEMLAHAGFDDALTRGAGFGGEGMAGFLISEISQQLAAQEAFGIAQLIEAKLDDRK